MSNEFSQTSLLKLRLSCLGNWKTKKKQKARSPLASALLFKCQNYMGQNSLCRFYSEFWLTSSDWKCIHCQICIYNCQICIFIIIYQNCIKNISILSPRVELFSKLTFIKHVNSNYFSQKNPVADVWQCS